jgi:hypothetical protein
MAYNVNKSNGDLLVVVEDGTADVTSTSLSLIGKNYPGYGEFLNENFVHLMENFAGTTQPSPALEGQIWYDTSSRTLKVYNGSLFVNAGGGLQLDTTSTTVHYVSFVANETGTEPYKIARNKSLSIQPSTGFVGLNKNSAATARLEINNGVLARGLQSSTHTGAGEVGLHMHSDDGKSNRVLLDSYGSTNSSYVDFRRSRGTSSTPTAIQVNDALGGLGGFGYNGSAYVAGGSAVFLANQTWTGLVNGARFEVRLTENNANTAPSPKFIVYGNGDIEAVGDVIGFSLSDQTLKTDVERIQDALNKVIQLDGVTYKWIESSKKDTSLREVGVLAQQVKAVLPEVVSTRQDGYFGIRYEKLVPLLIEAIKELKLEVDSLKKPA